MHVGPTPHRTYFNHLVIKIQGRCPNKTLLHLHSLKDFDEVEICFQRVKASKDLNGQSELKRSSEDGLPKVKEKKTLKSLKKFLFKKKE
jgi:hypothetical protein